MSVKQLKYSIIIPAHNEETRISHTLGSYAHEFVDSEIIVVLNGCNDGTRGIVEHFQTIYPNIRLVDIPAAIGKGGAVRAGFLVAKAPIIAYVDADGSTTSNEMRRLCELLGEADCAIASRWLVGSSVSVRQPLMRRIASRCFNAAVRLLFGLPFSDTQCGAKIFRRAAVEQVMFDVETSNLAFDVDLLLHLKRKRFRILELPTTWVDTTGTRVRLVSASAKMLASIVRLRLKRSLLSLVVPLFDRFFPTLPMTAQSQLRILIINWRDPQHPQAGGAETYLFEQARCWVEWGHQVDWLTAGFPGCQPRVEYGGVRFRRVGNAFSVYGVVPLTYLREFRQHFDVVIDSENGIPFFTPFYSLKPKLRVVYHVHQEVFRRHLPAVLAYPLMWCEAVFVPWLYRNIALVTISEDTRKQLNDLGIEDSRMGVVHCGVDSSLRPGSKAHVPTVLALGRLKAYKRVERIVDAFAAVRNEIPEAKLRIAGSGDQEEVLRRRVAELALADAVIFEGFVSDERKAELLAEAWVLVSASEMEGWGISVIEANACATPAVAYDVPGLREAIVHGENGLLVQDGESLAPAILRVLKEASLRGELEAGSLKRAAAFSWKESARRMLGELMQAIVGERVRSVDLNEEWALVSTSHARAGSSTPSYAFHRREFLSQFTGLPDVDDARSR